MTNPKVIIADSDVNYIAPLQYKFINDDAHYFADNNRDYREFGAFFFV